MKRPALATEKGRRRWRRRRRRNQNEFFTESNETLALKSLTTAKIEKCIDI